MSPRWMIPVLLVASLSAGGCCCGPMGQFGPVGHCGPGPFAQRFLYGSCNTGHCGAACGSSCGPSCGPGGCGGAVTSSCGPGGCGTGCGDCGGGIKYWLGGRTYCGSGCCDRYWGEWFSDPPDACDPCNSCGDWNGASCCRPGFFRRLVAGVQGCRNCGSDCGGTCGGAYVGAYRPSCSTCGGGHGSTGILHENWEHGPTPAVPPGTPLEKAQVQPNTRLTRTAPPRMAPAPQATQVRTTQPSPQVRSVRPQVRTARPEIQQTSGMSNMRR